METNILIYEPKTQNDCNQPNQNQEKFASHFNLIHCKYQQYESLKWEKNQK